MTHEEALKTARELEVWKCLAFDLESVPALEAALQLAIIAAHAQGERAATLRCAEIVRNADVVRIGGYDREDDGRATLERAADEIRAMVKE